MSELIVVIGGVKNRDYELLLHNDKYNGGKYEGPGWSTTKATEKGDVALIYMATYGAIVARATFVEKAYPANDPWPYRAGFDKVTMLRRHLTLDDIRRHFPQWKWAISKGRRGKVTVPKHFTPKLLALAR